MRMNTNPTPTNMEAPEIDLGFALIILGSKCDIRETPSLSCS
jgi:hypothetical protein